MPGAACLQLEEPKWKASLLSKEGSAATPAPQNGNTPTMLATSVSRASVSQKKPLG